MADPQTAETSVQSIYDAVADTYDYVTRRNDYDKWVGLYVGLIERHGAPGKRMLDIGAGTGLASIRFANAGYDVTAVDISPEMLRQAKAKPGAEDVRFVVADVRDLPDLGLFDVAVTLGEPFIYLLDDRELAAALTGVAGLLAPGALFAFDLGTAGFFQRHLAKVVVDELDGELTVVRGAASERDPRAADYLLDRFTTDDGVTWRRSSQRHSWSYFPPDLVDRLVREAGLVPVATHGLYQGRLAEYADETLHRKSFVIARKPAWRIPS